MPHSCKEHENLGQMTADVLGQYEGGKDDACALRALHGELSTCYISQGDLVPTQVGEGPDNRQGLISIHLMSLF